MADQTNIEDNPLNQALAGLGKTINTITDKVEAGKTKVRQYKSQIIEKLKMVVSQLNELKVNNNLKALPQLRKQLQDNQVTLQQKTEELDLTKGKLNEANQNLQQLQQNINDINKQIDEKNQQITNLTNSGKQKDKAIQELDQQVRDLDKQKQEAEKKLLSAQTQIDSIIQKIGQLNSALVNQIQLIDTIADELGDLDNGDVAEQFKEVTANIASIVDMINNPSQEEPEPQSSSGVEALYNNFINADQRKKDSFYASLRGTSNQNAIDIIQRNIRNAIDKNDQEAINNIKSALQTILNTNSGNISLLKGGKYNNYIRRKTMRKRHVKTRKRKTRKLGTRKLGNSRKFGQKGGYIYNTSKDLDKASSIISSSNSTAKSTDKSTRKKRKTKNVSI